VKFRDVRDVGELLSRLGDIWFGSFKLRINLPRFGRDDGRKEKIAAEPETSKVGEARYRDGRSFREALDVRIV
ncbi:hypothetical protein A2U01_0105175, partial [Trifolium medium]|nr:hypothetical protein [Trifolium medium]